MTRIHFSRIGTYILVPMQRQACIWVPMLHFFQSLWCPLHFSTFFRKGNFVYTELVARTVLKTEAKLAHLSCFLSSRTKGTASDGCTFSCLRIRPWKTGNMLVSIDPGVKLKLEIIKFVYYNNPSHLPMPHILSPPYRDPNVCT